MKLDRVIAVDEEAQRLAERAELGPEFADSPPRAALTSADLLVLGPTSLERLRGWRAAGVRTPALLVQGRGGELPDERAVLEPLAVVREATPDAVREALDRFEAQRVSAQVRVPRGVVDLARRQLIRADGSAKLSQQQADLLAYLAARPHQQVSKEELLEQVWGYAPTVRSRAVEMAVSRLRKLVEPDPSDPTVLLTARGGGYCYVPPAEEAVGHLPARGTALVGRDDLLAEVDATLAQHRAAVLVGAPGIGKTRLAVEVAHRVAEEGRDVRWCDLSEVEPGGLLTAVASALDVSVLPTAGARTVAERLADGLLGRGCCLVVLDGVDRLAEVVGPLMAELRALCPEAWLLAASQVPVEQPGLHLREVPALRRDPAEVLFRRRAAEAGATELDGLDELLAALDGHPLAIELAAGRARTTPVADLTAAVASSPVAAVDHAWERLDVRAQADLAALARCPRQFPVELAEEVLGEGGRDRLYALVDRSLVQRRGGEFVLLGPVRQRVQELKEAPDVARRVEDWLVRLAVAEVERARGIEARAAAQTLARWVDPLDGALSARLGTPESADLALALAHLYRAHGTLPQRAEVIDRALRALDVDDYPHEAARLLHARHQVSQVLDPERGHSDALRALELARRGGDDELLGWCLADAARAEARTPGGTTRYAEEAVSFCRARGLDAALLAARFQRLAVDAKADPALRPALLGAAEEARERLLEQGYFFEALSFGHTLASGLTTVGESERAAHARARLRAMLDIFPDRYTRGVLLNVETWALADEGDSEGALACLEERRRLLFGVRGEPDGWLLRDRGEVLIDLGRHVEAELDLSRAAAVLDHPTAVCGVWGTWATSDLDRGQYERGWSKATKALEAKSFPFMRAMASLWRAMASLLLERVDEASADLAEVPFEILGQHPAQQVGIATACVATARGDAEALRHSVGAVRRHLGDDWVSGCAAEVLDALVQADTDALAAIVAGERVASGQVRWRVLARAALAAIQNAAVEEGTRAG